MNILPICLKVWSILSKISMSVNLIHFPLFHQVMVSGVMDPNVEHFIVYLLSLDRGHLSLVMLTEAGPTEMNFM